MQITRDLGILVYLFVIFGHARKVSRRPSSYYYGRTGGGKIMQSAHQAARHRAHNIRNLDGLIDTPSRHWHSSSSDGFSLSGRAGSMCDRYDEQATACRESCFYCCSDDFCYNNIYDAPDCIGPGGGDGCENRHCPNAASCLGSGCLVDEQGYCFGPTSTQPVIFSRNFCDKEDVTDKNLIMYVADPTPTGADYFCTTPAGSNTFDYIHSTDQRLFQRQAYFWKHTIAIPILEDGAFELVMGAVEITSESYQISRNMTAILNGKHDIFRHWEFPTREYHKVTFRHLRFLVENGVTQMVAGGKTSDIVNNVINLEMKGDLFDGKVNGNFQIQTLYVMKL